MELDSWCICGKPVFELGSLYCSNECKNSDNNSNNTSIINSMNQFQAPPTNLHFSITITPNLFKASDSNAKVSTPSSMSSSYTDSTYSSSYTSTYTTYTLDHNCNDYNYHCCNKNYEDEFDDDYYTSYYSTSNPIDIPSPRTQAKSDPALEPNKGTFGKEKSIF
ncbi:hypothetical protein C1645_758020 [Glomus cerebriforme]|uniref:Uncharacterized protein n=1 Tax=Glomus cerebriforme TaxID=658196 RepID=A0A397TAG3_9GLOM|nr:hypothetical protein C1645_758020 [Glomus cerebriforme]